MTGKVRTKSLRALHWDEGKHPRDDRGRFSRTPGGRWAIGAVRSIAARFGDIGVAEGGWEPQGRLSTGKGGFIDLGAISRGARERTAARTSADEPFRGAMGGAGARMEAARKRAGLPGRTPGGASAGIPLGSKLTPEVARGLTGEQLHAGMLRYGDNTATGKRLRDEQFRRNNEAILNPGRAVREAEQAQGAGRTPGGFAPMPAAARVDAAEANIRAILKDKVPSGEWLGLADLRDALGSRHRRADVDEALTRIADDAPDIRIIPVANRKALKQRDHDAALPLGGEEMNAIALQAGARPVSPGRTPGGVESSDDFLARMSAKRQAAKEAGGVTTSKPAEAKPSVHAAMKAAGIERPDDYNAKSAISRANDRLGRGEDPSTVAGYLREQARALELEREEVSPDDEQRYSELTQSINSLRRTAKALEGGAAPKAPGDTSVDTSRVTRKTGGVTTPQTTYQVGQRVEAQAYSFDKPGTPREWYPGTIERAEPIGDPSKGRFDLMVRLDDGRRVPHTVGPRGGGKAVRPIGDGGTGEVATPQDRQQAAIKLGTSFSGNPYSKLPTLEALTDDDFKALTPEQQDNVRFLASKLADRQTGEAGDRARALEARFGKWGQAGGVTTPPSAAPSAPVAKTTTLDWSAVRESPASDLQVGDSFINPSAGTGYRTSGDGEVRGVGFQPLEGTVWTVTGRQGNKVTATNAAGKELSQNIPPGKKVLRVGTEGPAARQQAGMERMRREADAKTAAARVEHLATRDGVPPTDGRPDITSYATKRSANRYHRWDLATSKGRDRTMAPDIARAHGGGIDDQPAGAEVLNPVNGTGDYRYRIFNENTGATIEEGTTRDAAEAFGFADRIFDETGTRGMARSKGVGPVQFEARQIERPKDTSRGDFGRGPFYNHDVYQINADGSERKVSSHASMERAQRAAADRNDQEVINRAKAPAKVPGTSNFRNGDGTDYALPASNSDIYRKHRDVTREEFDAMTPDQREAILADLRKVRDSKEQVSSTIASNRSGFYGATLRGTKDAPWVKGATDKIRELTYTAPPPVDNSREGRAKRLAEGDTSAIWASKNMEELNEATRAAGLTGFPLSWKRNKAEQFIRNQITAGDRLRNLKSYQPADVADALRGATDREALALLDVIEDRQGITKADMAAIAKLWGGKLKAGDKRAQMHALSAMAKDAQVADVPNAPQRRSAAQVREESAIARAGSGKVVKSVVTVNDDSSTTTTPGQYAERLRAAGLHAAATEVDDGNFAGAAEKIERATMPGGSAGRLPIEQRTELRAYAAELRTKGRRDLGLNRPAPAGARIETTRGGNIKVPETTREARRALEGPTPETRAMVREVKKTYPDAQKVRQSLRGMSKEQFDALAPADQQAVRDYIDEYARTAGENLELRNIRHRINGEPEEVAQERVGTMSPILALNLIGNQDTKLGRAVQGQIERAQQRRAAQGRTPGGRTAAAAPKAKAKVGDRVRLKPSSGSEATSGKILSVMGSGPEATYEVDTVDATGYRRTEYLSPRDFLAPERSSAVDHADVAARLKAAATRAEAEAAIANLKRPDLDKIYEELRRGEPATPFNQGGLTGRTLAEARTNLVELAVGRNLDSRAIERAGRTPGGKA